MAYEPWHTPPHGIDKAALWFVLIAVDGKAQTLRRWRFGPLEYVWCRLVYLRPLDARG